MAEQERTFLRFLLEASTRQVKLLLATSSPTQQRALGEVCYNILYGELDPKILQKLKPYHLLVRQLADKKFPISQRRKLTNRRAKSVVNILRIIESILP